MTILQWVVLIIAFSFSLGSLWHLRKDAKNNQPIHIVTVLQVLLYLSVSIIFLFSPWNKLHLVWVIPASFVFSLLGFIILRIPIIGTLLRMIILLFGRIFLVGIGGNITGVPYGK